ncbi:MAG: FkbM family methyltransferase [Nitrospirae bacterium]|nr:FkbM family methyltransferase [Nitrospirota bacterium]
MFGNRGIKEILRAIIGKQHYIAIINMARNYPDFLENTSRYLTGIGSYPYDIKIKTPIGIIEPKLYSHHDMLTVNEIFCRSDYPADESVSTVVDIGSNIGISALYFLSRNNESKCYLYEPDKRNIEKLKKNLSGFLKRYSLHENAVSYESGQLEFGIEATGRYGGIGIKSKEMIIVNCLEINDVIKNVLSNEGYIDILKIDTEGVEIKTVENIEVDLLRRIKIIYLEAKPKHQLHSSIFKQKQYGSVCQLVNKEHITLIRLPLVKGKKSPLADFE